MKYTPTHFKTSRLASMLVAAIGVTLALPAASIAQDEVEAPTIEVRGRDWNAIANGEQVASTEAGTDFGARNTLDGYRQRVFYIRNTGDGALELGNPDDPEAPAVTLSGDGASQFEVTHQPSASVSSSSRRHHRSTSFAITFNPDTEGVHSAVVSIASNDAENSPFEFVIQGEGTPSNDDHSDRYQFATPIEIGSEVAGTLEEARDEDWFTFTLAEHMEITALSATDVNVKAGLYSSSGRFITSNDDDGGDGNFLITRVIEAGQYYLKVRASNREDTGDYVFTVSGVPADIAPEIAVSGNGTEIVSGAAEASADDGTDFGELLVGYRRSRSFVITNEGTATLELGEVLVSEDSGFAVSRNPSSSLRPGRSTSLKISFSPLAEGPASASVSIANIDDDENPFVFTVSGVGTVPPPDDHGNSAEEATALADAEAAGFIGEPEDDDYFSFTTDVEVQVVIESSGDTDTVGTLYDAEGDRLERDSNDGEGRNFRIVEVVGAGTYFIRVSASGHDTGAYTLTLTLSEPAPEMSVHGYTVTRRHRHHKHYTSVEIPSGSAEASVETKTDFGAVEVTDNTQTLSFKIRNSGTTALELNGDPVVSIDGDGAAAFTVSRDPATSIRPGRSTYFRITFDPSAEGVATAVVSIANNDGDENPYTFAIQGEGVVTPAEEVPDEGVPAK